MVSELLSTRCKVSTVLASEGEGKGVGIVVMYKVFEILLKWHRAMTLQQDKDIDPELDLLALGSSYV